MDPMTGMSGGAMLPDEESAGKFTGQEPAAPPTADDADYELEGLSVRKAKNGGVVVTCSKRLRHPEALPEKSNIPHYKSDDYAFTSPEDALAFIQQELAGPAPTAGGSGVQGAPSPRY